VAERTFIQSERTMTADRLLVQPIVKVTLKRFIFCTPALIILSLSTSDARSQGLLRRLGEQFREGAQLRLPEARSIPPGGPAFRPDLTRPPGSALPGSALPSTSNYNAPGAARRPIESQSQREENIRRAPVSGRSNAASTSTQQMEPGSRLGVRVETPPPVFVPGRPPRATRGAAVVLTAPGSGAEAAGLIAGDIIVSVNGRVVSDVEQFLAFLSSLAPGDRVQMKYVRNKNLFATTAVMADRSGTLDESTYADIQSMAGLLGTSTEGNRPDAGVATGGAQPEPSTLGGIGKAVGSWLGGGDSAAPSQASDAAPLNTTNDDPFLRGFDPVIPSDYESLQARDIESALLPNTQAMPTDPPSLHSAERSEPKEISDAELLPPPLRKVTEEDPLNSEPLTGSERKRVAELMREVERLQQRIRQLESSQD